MACEETVPFLIEGETIHLARAGAELHSLENTTHAPPARRAAAASDGRLVAPMNGRVVAVNAKAGDTAEAGPRPRRARSHEDGARAERAPRSRVKAVHVAPARRSRPASCWSSWSRVMNRAHPALTDEHEALRDTMRRFVAREIAPHAAAWDEAEEFPRELYRRRPTPACSASAFRRNTAARPRTCSPT